MLRKLASPRPAGPLLAAAALAASLAAAPAAAQAPQRPDTARPAPRVLGRPADPVADSIARAQAARAAADTARRPPSAPARSGPRVLGRPADPAADSAARAAAAAPAPSSPPRPASATAPQAGPRLLGRPVNGAPATVPGAPVTVSQAAQAPPRLLGRPTGSAVPAPASAAHAPLRPNAARCGLAGYPVLRSDPLPGELRCLYGVRGVGRFGLLSYQDVPVYQPVTPMPGTHVVGIPGLPEPAPGESYEAWEWRMLTTPFGPAVRNVYNGLELLDPVVASRILRFERELARLGVRARRRETFRTAERQAYIFQQGRSRPGPVATTTLTSWHSRTDRLGRPAGRAADYDVAPSQLPRFHEAAAAAGLESYGADSNDPGHVYYVGTEWLTPVELLVMRTLPRVPHVTLETGRPADEVHSRASLESWRLLSREFAARPFDPRPAIEPVRIPRPAARIAVPRPKPVPPPVPPRRRGG